MMTPFTPSIRDTNKPRILIVDDNLRFSQSARQTLQSWGHYVVCEENDAASALATAPSFRPDLNLDRLRADYLPIRLPRFGRRPGNCFGSETHVPEASQQQTQLDYRT